MNSSIFEQRSRFAMIGALMVIISLMFLFYMGSSLVSSTKKYLEQMEVCRNARCTSFFVHHYTNLFTFFKLRSFEDFFDLCVPSI